MSVNSKMTALADEIRELSGTSEAIGLDAMKAHINEANIDVATEADLIEQIVDALEGKAAGGEQATPEISVNSNGLITATAGTKTSTYQLAFQPAKTITPSTTSQIAVSSSYYTGGNIMVAGDANLIADNIKSGVSIFGVNGTLIEGGGSEGDINVEDGLITRTISNCTNSRVSNIGSGTFESCYRLISVNFPKCTTIDYRAFFGCSSLITASFPVCTTIGHNAFTWCYSLTTLSFPACTFISTNAFWSCRSLTSVNFPVCTTINSSAFNQCSNLTSVSFPACTTINNHAFDSCSKLTTISFPMCTTIGNSAFFKCYNLKSLYLTNSVVCTLSHSNAFTSTPIGGYSNVTGTYGSIYVPASLLTSYQTATNWTYFRSRFVAFDDGVNIITFTLENTEYQAEEGMTWGEWVESEYNTGYYYISNDFVYFYNGDIVIDSNYRHVKSTFIVNSDEVYGVIPDMIG